MKAIKLSNDRLQLMVERSLEQRYNKCIYNRERGKIAMRDPKVGELLIEIGDEGCKVEPQVQNSQLSAWKILGLGLLGLMLASLGIAFFPPILVMIIAGGIILAWSLRRLQRIMKKQQQVMTFAKEVSLYLEHRLA